MRSHAVAVACLSLPLSPVLGSTFTTSTTTCPVGGETFQHSAYMSYSTFSELPDGMPIGSAEFPIELTECPDNGLVLYREFDEAEVPVLAQIVRSPEYQSLRQAETPYYRAYHLATTMKEDMRDRAGLLLAATWQAKNGSNTEQARRYNEEFVALATQAATDVSLPSLVIRARATNVLREVRRFKDAEALRSLLQRFSEPNEGDSEDEAAERSGLGRYLNRLAAPIARNDASRAPIDMLGLRVATERCLAASAPEGEPLTSFEKSFCDSPEVSNAMAKLREQRQELDTLVSDSPEVSSKRR